jgi:hypothetical protein
MPNFFKKYLLLFKICHSISVVILYSVIKYLRKETENLPLILTGKKMTSEKTYQKAELHAVTTFWTSFLNS